MARLKTLPKALMVAAVIGGIGAAAYKFMPAPQPKPVEAAATPVEATQAPVVQAQAPATYAPPVQEAAAPVVAQAPAPTGKLPGAGIASGQKTGTNWPMAEDIIKSCSTNDYPLRNVITNGTLDNINKVYNDPNSQFGIAQEDGLVAQAEVDKTMMSRIVAVFPFFSVEIHAIAADGSPIRSLADLAGKRVIEGPEGSGTNITVQRIKQLTGIQWQTVPGNLSQAAGLKAVQAGQADVEFIVAGQPIEVLKGAHGVKLIPIQHPALDKFGYYTKAQLPTGAYPWLANSVGTYKVNNVLVTFAYKNQYQTEISNLVTCITRHVGDLQVNGHPKWRDVDPLDITRVKWPVHPAALAAIKREAKKQ